MQPDDYGAAGIVEIHVRSALDGSSEPSLFWRAPGKGSKPLLVGLHHWSGDRHTYVDRMLPLARKHGWHLLLPEFRGPNLATNPRAREACASRLAMQDIVDAVHEVVSTSAVDPKSIFLLGASGGGHMAMMMAGHAPGLWRSVGAFCGITDLEVWHGENANYAQHIEACCGGTPSDATRAEYLARSPIAHAKEIAKAELAIYHGKYDDSVPHAHSLRLFQEMGKVAPSARVFLDIFDGGHEMRLDLAERRFLTGRETGGATATG